MSTWNSYFRYSGRLHTHILRNLHSTIPARWTNTTYPPTHPLRGNGNKEIHWCCTSLSFPPPLQYNKFPMCVPALFQRFVQKLDNSQSKTVKTANSFLSNVSKCVYHYHCWPNTSGTLFFFTTAALSYEAKQVATSNREKKGNASSAVLSSPRGHYYIYPETMCGLCCWIYLLCFLFLIGFHRQLPIREADTGTSTYQATQTAREDHSTSGKWPAIPIANMY